MKRHCRCFVPLILLLGLAAPVAAQAPRFDWAHVLPLTLAPTTQYNKYPYQVAAHPGSGVVVLGLEHAVKRYGSYSFGNLQLVRMSRSGTVVWSRHFGGNGLGFQLEVLPDGRQYLFGQYVDSLRLGPQHLLQAPATGTGLFLALLDSTGSPAWVKDFHALYGASYNPLALTCTAQGNVIVGYTSNAVLPASVMIREYDPAGTEVRSISQQGMSTVYSLDVDDSGSLYASGGCVSMAGGTFNGVTFLPQVAGNGYNKYLVRYRPNGVPAWVKFVQDATCTPSQVRSDKAGGAYWVGGLIDAATFGSFHVSGPPTGSSRTYFTARLDSAGNYLFAHQVPATQSDGAAHGSQKFMQVDAAGNLVLTGLTLGSLNWGSGWQTAAGSSPELLVHQTSPAGTTGWVKTSSAPFSTTGQQLSIGADGAIYVVGMGRGTVLFDSLSLTGPSTTEDFPFVVRLSSGTVLSQQAQEINRPLLALYPNPAAAQVQLQAASGSRIAQVVLTDLLGRVKLQRQLAGSSQGTLPLTELPGGLYLLRAEVDGQWVTQQLRKE